MRERVCVRKQEKKRVNEHGETVKEKRERERSYIRHTVSIARQAGSSGTRSIAAGGSSSCGHQHRQVMSEKVMSEKHRVRKVALNMTG